VALLSRFPGCRGEATTARRDEGRKPPSPPLSARAGAFTPDNASTPATFVNSHNAAALGMALSAEASPAEI
jgi:hypothetical protein